jgi:SpoVK/Ycf46/Vps4 family AAA+-type ATPase
VDKYIGESARLIREMFGYAKEHQPCVIFMDEIDAIGGRRFSEGTSADRYSSFMHASAWIILSQSRSAMYFSLRVRTSVAKI